MADEAMEQFWEDLDSGEVHIRDKWQFALKSEFFPQSGQESSEYTQEFYLFIPNSLQVNSNTYSKQEFYLDETNLIRYKTPEFTFAQLMDSQDLRSPLTRIRSLCSLDDTSQNRVQLSDELKLFANVVRSLLRRDVKLLIFSLGSNGTSGPSADFQSRCTQLCADIKQLRTLYAEAESMYLEKWKDPLFYRQMVYIDEFLSYSISYYLTGLLESIRLTGNPNLADVDTVIGDLLIGEKKLTDTFVNKGNIKAVGGDTIEGEGVIYRFGMLNKFVIDALLLVTNRLSSVEHVQKAYQHWIGAFSAGVAMILYFSLFLWLGNVFVINSAPFLFLMVIAYILKDRMKEWLRDYSYIQASQWFPDYTTVIKSQDGKTDLGIIKESFSFINQSQLPSEVSEMRNAEFHAVLETYQRPENIIFYKRIVGMYASEFTSARRHRLNIIFRFNIHRFLYKAADPFETHLVIDPATRKLVSVRLPKVYHLNLIIRTTSSTNSPAVEFKKLRIVIDKNGIKRIEPLKAVSKN